MKSSATIVDHQAKWSVPSPEGYCDVDPKNVREGTEPNQRAAGSQTSQWKELEGAPILGSTFLLMVRLH